MFSFDESEELRLIRIILENHTAVVIDEKDGDRTFLDHMCHKGYLRKFGNEFEDKNYYNINKKFKNIIIELLKKVDNGKN